MGNVPSYEAPGDMTDSRCVRDLVRWGHRMLDRGHRNMVLDLTHVTQIDSSLLAAVVLLSQRARSAHATITLLNAPERFENLMHLYRVFQPLQSAGVEFSSDTCDA